MTSNSDQIAPLLMAHGRKFLRLPLATTGQPARFFLLLALALLLVPGSLGAEESVMQRGNVTITSQQVVQDVVVADGDLSIFGRVKGSVFVVNGEVKVNAGGVVQGNVTVVAGNLWVLAGAVVEGEINVFSGQAHLDQGAKVGPQVRVVEKVPSLTPEKVALISRYVIFDRRVPADSVPLSALSGLDLSGLHLRKVSEQRAVRLDLFELGSVPLNLDEFADSNELLYRGHDVRVRVVGIRLKSTNGLTALWARVRRQFEDKVSQSVHNSLGEGAHWFFRYRGTSYCLWSQRTTLIGVMVRHEDDDPTKEEWKWVEDLRDRVILSLWSLFSRVSTPTNENKP